MKITETEITKTIEHPMEGFLNIEPNTTLVTHTERTTELVKIAEYDSKDDEVETAFQEIYDKAMTGYERLQDEMDVTEAKYLPRMAEVSVQHLKAALDAASLKARLKEHKDKLNVKRKGGNTNTTINNTVVMSREDLLKQWTEEAKTEVINSEAVDVTHVQIEKDD